MVCSTHIVFDLNLLFLLFTKKEVEGSRRGSRKGSRKGEGVQKEGPGIVYNNNNNLYLHYSGRREERRKKNKYRKQNSRRFIVDIIMQVNELVCSSQSSKAFELAAAYLQITKGMKETNNNY